MTRARNLGELAGNTYISGGDQPINPNASGGNGGSGIVIIRYLL